MKQRIKKVKQVGVRLSPDEKAKFTQRATERNMSVAEYLRDLARRDIESVAANKAA